MDLLKYNDMILLLRALSFSNVMRQTRNVEPTLDKSRTVRCRLGLQPLKYKLWRWL